MHSCKFATKEFQEFFKNENYKIKMKPSNSKHIQLKSNKIIKKIPIRHFLEDNIHLIPLFYRDPSSIYCAHSVSQLVFKNFLKIDKNKNLIFRKKSVELLNFLNGSKNVFDDDDDEYFINVFDDDDNDLLKFIKQRIPNINTIYIETLKKNKKFLNKQVWVEIATTKYEEALNIINDFFPKFPKENKILLKEMKYGDFF